MILRFARTKALRPRSLGAAAAAVLLFGLFPMSPASLAQQSTALEHLDHLARVGRNLSARLQPQIRNALSAGGEQLITLTDNVEEIKVAKSGGAKGRASRPKPLSQGFGNDPFAAEDLATRLSGMTQSETTAGWCGENAVLGFNDSGSFVATLLLGASPSGSLSFNGWSRSTNHGGSYTDLGALIADPLPPGIMFRDLFGDPLVGCTGTSTFYYGSLAIDTGPGFSFANSGISVSRSTDGGAFWGGAVMAVAKDAFLHFLDKPWMAVQPGPTASPGDDIVHITYTDFDFTGFEDPGSALCPEEERTAIEYVRSKNGGATWSTPLILEEVCSGDLATFLQGSQVEAGLGSDVYVAWEHYTDPSADRDIRLAKSTNGGGSFGSPALVTSVTPIGDGFVLQGNFRSFLDLQGLAVDRSSGPGSGSVYIAWHDGRNRSKPDPFGFCGNTPTYCFGDVLFTKSVDRGASWSAPVRVNDDAVTLGVDQYMPALDVDRSGNIWVAFYDRRRDTRNLLIDTFVAKSTNGGLNWTNKQVTRTHFAPVTGWQDVVVNPFYMGDYIAAVADATGTFPGVIVAWGDNSLGDANVLQSRL